MVKYKLFFYNLRGSAELSRFLFKVADVEFEDIRINKETDWPALKPEMPFGALPVLEVDGVKFCQSAAIARFLAKEFKLMGENNRDEFLIDELHEMCAEVFQRDLTKIFYEQDPEKKSELAKEFAKGTLQKYMDFFEMRLKQNNDGTGFYIGDKVTLADLIVHNVLTRIEVYMQKLGADTKLSSRKLLQPLIQRVEALPNIAKWLKERPVTEM